MEERGAFPGWLNRLWWILLPGVLSAAMWALGLLPYLFSAWTGDRATGLAAVAGGKSVEIPIFLVLALLFVSWLLISLALMHLWILMAVGFRVLRRAQFRPEEKWKLAGASLALLLVYSPRLAGMMSKLF